MYLEEEFRLPYSEPSYVKVRHYDGVAFEATAYFMGGENDNMVECVMVGDDLGDDRRFIFDRDNVEFLGREDFCLTCGQIGCEWD